MLVFALPLASPWPSSPHRGFDGLTAAARAARRRGIIDAKWAKKLERLDITFAVVRNISEERIIEFERDFIALLLHSGPAPGVFVADVAAADSDDYEKEFFGESLTESSGDFQG